MASRAVTAERLDWAVRRLTECRSTSAVVAEFSDSAGISRRQARRLVARAHQVLVDDLEEVGLERKALVAQLVHALTEALSKSLASNQPAAAVAAVRAIADLCQLTPSSRRL